MPRDPHKLSAFVLADELVIDVYRATRDFPVEERYGLQSQIRRAAVSVTTNIVEGSARRTQRDYLHYVFVALGSASEVAYLVGVSARLGFLDEPAATRLERGYSRVVRALQGLVNFLAAQSPKSEVRSPKSHSQNWK